MGQQSVELSAGKRIGQYEILAPLGAGVTGEVYRARDTQRDREVTIKLLPRNLGETPERHKQFERQARASIRLDHPTIRALYGLEHQNGLEFLVMEYLPGETLAKRLATGPLPVHETLRIAIQVAEALEAAHAQGVIHSGLKPTNILLTKDGVKLLDFGQSGALGLIPSVEDVFRTPHPDQASPAAKTLASAIAYLAPEQIEGKDADARSDIFAFGAVLHEMMTGMKAFPGTTPPSVAAGVVGIEPPSIASLQPGAPPELDLLVRACLAKDPAARLQSAHDLEVELKWILDRISGPDTPVTDRGGQRRSLERLAWWTAIGALVLAVGMIVAYWLRPTPGSPAPTLQSAIRLPENLELSPRGASIAFSPGGRRLVVVGSVGDVRPRLWLRSAGGTEWKSLPGTEGASYPFWGPDGHTIAFFANHMLQRIDLASNAVLTICAAPDGRGGTWNEQGVIVFTPVSSGGLYRVSAEGGTPIQVSFPASAAVSHRFPHFLPGGRYLLFLAKMKTPSEQSGVYALDLESGRVQFLLHTENETRYVEPGYLAFLRKGKLLVQRFSLAGLLVEGRPIQVADGVRATEAGAGEFSFSRTGSLLYQADSRHASTQLTWFSLDGRELGTIGKPEEFAAMTLSPDGLRVAVRVQEAEGDSPIWIYDLANAVHRRLTPETGRFADPVWSPSGSSIAYDDAQTLYIGTAGGNLPARKVFSGREVRPTGWSPNGQLLAVDVAGNKGLDIWLLPMSGSRKPYPLLATPFNESQGTFSSDGRWFSYISDESGVRQLYVMALRGGGEARQISMSGAVAGGWVRGHDKLAYQTPGGRFFVVDAITHGKKLIVGTPRELLGGRRLESDVKIPGLRCFSRDGKRMLLPVGVSGRKDSGTLLNLVTNWHVSLEEK
jgi:serine/threonine protein kinase/Tol biopolymer transport system component